ncbi:MAG: LLM class F420-dependent oxidoreductase [Porticoccaceae bacterium]
MKIGVVYPQIELGGDPEALRRIGLATEDLGYDHLLMYDHVVGASHENRDPPLWGPYTEKDPFHDPLVAFSYLAAITRRIELVTGILILPQRQTVLAAQQCADLDLLSGQRLRLGVGSGWNYVEYEALGQDFASRGARLGEQVELLRRLWREPQVTFEGRFDRIDRGAINPRPRRDIPIWMGGFSEPAFRRAAALADGFIFAGALTSSYTGKDTTVASVLDGWKRVRHHLAAKGRAEQNFGAELIMLEAGNTDQVVDTLKRWQDAGGTSASVFTMGLGFRRVEQHQDYLEKVKAKLASLR